MDELSKGQLHVPTLDELRACVIPRRDALVERENLGPALVPTSLPATEDIPKARLSLRADAFLRHAVLPGSRDLTLEQRWDALGVTSGSVKESTLAELFGNGLIRLECKGRVRRLHLFNKAWEYLGLEPPTGEGDGGSIHRALAARLATIFKKRGYEVRIEHEIGACHKRVDVLCYGKNRIGIEIGVSRPGQEIRNLRADLEANVLDLILFVSPDPDMVKTVRLLAGKDPIVCRHLGRIRFFHFDGEVEL